MSAEYKKHFPRLVDEYRKWRTYDLARTPAAVRSALEAIESTLHRAAACIGAYTTGDPDITGETSMRSAWGLINTETQETPDRPLLAGETIEQILRSWSRAAAAAKKNVPTKRYARTALKMTANSLYALRTNAGLKCTSTANGDAVAELVSISSKAGDRSITKDAAGKALKVVISNQGRERRKKRGV